MTSDDAVLDPASAGWLIRANRLALLAHVVASTIHDVNNALQVISGGLELLELAPSDPLTARRPLAHQTDRASEGLARLAAFARDRGTSEPASCDVRAVAAEALALRAHPLRKLRLRPSLDGEPAPVVTSRHDVLQILLNLVINAEQALPLAVAARVAVDRTAGQVRPSSRTTVPACQPTPTGCSPAGDPSGRGRSTGIGLRSRQLAERLGGTLSHRPRQDGGAVFTLALPA